MCRFSQMWHTHLDMIYTMVGEYDLALDEIEKLLSIPSRMSVHKLRLYSTWDLLRTASYGNRPCAKPIRFGAVLPSGSAEYHNRKWPSTKDTRL